MAEPETADDRPHAQPEEQQPAAGPADDVEELSAAEQATSFQELSAELRRRKAALDEMPDGPRPRVPGATYKRRKVFIDWHLQVNYVGVYLGTFTLLAVGFLALNYVFTSFFQRALAIQTQRPFAEHTDTVLLITLNMIFVLLLVIGMAVYAIIQSHRVAGPVLRFRRALHQMHRRDYDFYLQLRSKDYLKDVADQMNAFNVALKHKDIVIADAALVLEDVARRHPAVREDLEEVAASLGDVVALLPVEPPSGQ